MAETCSDRELGKDDKMHLRQKYMYTSKHFSFVSILDIVFSGGDICSHWQTLVSLLVTRISEFLILKDNGLP
jgi:hypothetical protein